MTFDIQGHNVSLFHAPPLWSVSFFQQKLDKATRGARIESPAPQSRRVVGSRASSDSTLAASNHPPMASTTMTVEHGKVGTFCSCS